MVGAGTSFGQVKPTRHEIGHMRDTPTAGSRLRNYADFRTGKSAFGEWTFGTPFTSIDRRSL
jgi:hypothetical protein